MEENRKILERSILELNKALKENDINKAGRAIDLILKNDNFSWEGLENRKSKWKRLKKRVEKLVISKIKRT